MSGGLALLYSGKTVLLADILETQFPPVKGPSDPAGTEKFNEANSVFQYCIASEPKLTRTSGALQAIREFKLGKARGPKGILRHLSKKAMNFLTRQYFVQGWKHVRVASIL
jgi:hypothetical protein